MSAQNMHSEANSYKIEGETETIFKETTKFAKLLAVEKPHTLDQLNKEVANFSRSWSVEHSMSSNVLLLRPIQMIHIRQEELNSKHPSGVSPTNYATQIIGPSHSSAYPN